LVDIKK